MEALHNLNGIGALDTWSICNFRKNFSSLSFLFCPSIFSRCSFFIFFLLAMPWLLISALSLRHFSFSCNILWNSVGGIWPSCIVCEMILAMLSNLPWESSLMEWCFSWATIETLRYFRVAGAIKEKGRLTLPRAILTGSPTPLANAAMDNLFSRYVLWFFWCCRV